MQSVLHTQEKVNLQYLILVDNHCSWSDTKQRSLSVSHQFYTKSPYEGMYMYVWKLLTFTKRSLLGRN